MTTQTLNYEKVNEFEVNRENESATINIKVGNVVGSITLRTNWEDEVQISKESSIQNVQDAGIELDFEPLIQEYKELVQEIKDEKKQERREAAKVRYQNSWVHKVEKPESNNGTVEFIIESEEKFVERLSERLSLRKADPSFSVKYRDHKVHIRREDVGRRYSSNIKFTISDSLTDYKRRNYATPENAANKIVELVDEKIQSENHQEKIKKEQKQLRAEKLARLTEKFGEYGEFTVEKTYRRGNYYTYSFEIQIGETKYELTEHYRNEDQFDFGSFRELTKDQVIGMLKVLTQ